MSFPITILLADDDQDDAEIAAEALGAAGVHTDLHVVHDGEEAMDYLKRRGAFSTESSSPRPDIIILDLNMPRMDGLEALREIKLDATLRQIPVLVLTTSISPDDVFATYDGGASSFITKPTTFQQAVEALRVVGRYWGDTVRLAPGTGNHP